MDAVKITKKSLKFKNTNYIWNQYHFNGKNRVGDCSRISCGFIEELLKGNVQNTIDSFEEYYFKHFNYYVFLETTRAFKKKLEEGGIKITYNDAYYYSWIRVIYDTFYGIVQHERDITSMFIDGGFTVKHSTPEEDRKYSIDLFVSKDSKTYAIQVKPISYYIGIYNDKEVILKAFKRDIENNEKYLKKFPENSIIYLFYKEDDIMLLKFEELKELSKI